MTVHRVREVRMAAEVCGQLLLALPLSQHAQYLIQGFHPAECAFLLCLVAGHVAVVAGSLVVVRAGLPDPRAEGGKIAARRGLGGGHHPGPPHRRHISCLSGLLCPQLWHVQLSRIHIQLPIALSFLGGSHNQGCEPEAAGVQRLIGEVGAVQRGLQVAESRRAGVLVDPADWPAPVQQGVRGG